MFAIWITNPWVFSSLIKWIDKWFPSFGNRYEESVLIVQTLYRIHIYYNLG